MCNFFDAPKWETIKNYYRVAAPADLLLINEFEKESLFMESYRSPKGIIITDEQQDVGTVAEWGIVPSWAKDKGFQKNAVNAKIETLKELPTFKSSHGKRCLVPAEKFTEWQWDEPGNSKCKKRKHFITVKDREIFSFAGIYNEWNGTKTYTIITTASNELMTEIHNNKMRMPVVLKKEDEEAWLAKAPIEDFAFPYEVELVAVPEEPFEKPLTLF